MMNKENQIAAMIDGAEDVRDRWPEPMPLGPPQPIPLPLNGLPHTLRRWIQTLSASTQTPAELAAMLTFAALSVALANKVRVHVRPGHHEPVHVWTVVVLPPGSRKSPVVNAIAHPLREWERKRTERVRQDRLRALDERDVLERQLKAAKDAAAKGKGKGRMTSVQTLREELEGVQVQAVPRLLASDITAEELAQLMAENNGRVAIIAAEGDIFRSMAGRYSQSVTLFDLMDTPEDVRLARYVVSRLVATIPPDKDSMSQRGLHQKCKGKTGLQKAEQLEAVLRILIQHNLLRVEDRKSTGGRPPSPWVILHPDLRKTLSKVSKVGPPGTETALLSVLRMISERRTSRRRLPPWRRAIENIWEPQAEALKNWHMKRDEPDVVLQMNTGGGKTVVGLLMAQSLANETKGRVLYVCRITNWSSRPQTEPKRLDSPPPFATTLSTKSSDSLPPMHLSIFSYIDRLFQRVRLPCTDDE